MTYTVTKNLSANDLKIAEGLLSDLKDALEVSIP